MAVRYGKIRASFFDVSAPGTAITYGGAAYLDTIANADVTKKKQAITRGTARFWKTPNWSEFIQEGRIVSLYQQDQVSIDAGGFNDRELGAFLIQKMKEGVDPQGRSYVDVSGMGIEHLLTKYKHWAPIGEETTFVSSLLDAVAAPINTTVLAGTGVVNGLKSARLTSVDNVAEGDEIRITMNNGSVWVSTITGVEEEGWLDNQLTFADRIPVDADAGNAVQVRKGVLRIDSGETPVATTLAADCPTANQSAKLTSTTGIEAGMQIRIELDAGGWHTATLTAVNPVGAAANTVIFDEAMPSAATSGNNVECTIWALTSIAGFAEGQKVAIVLDDTSTFLTIIEEVDPEDGTIQLRDGLPSAASEGNSVTAYDYSTPATDDVTQIMQPALDDGWTLEFDNVLYEGTEDGTTHAPTGESIWDLLMATADMTGETFRLAYLDVGVAPQLEIKWQRAHNNSFMTLVYSGNTATASATDNYHQGVIHSIAREQDSDIITRLYPVPSDGRISFDSCSAAAITAATAAGFTITTSTDLWRPDYIEYDAGVSAHGVLETTERFGSITLTKQATAAEVEAASDAMLQQCMTRLLEAQERTVWRVKAHMHRPVFPGQYLGIDNVLEPLGDELEGPTYSTLYVLEVRESLAPSGVIMTDLVLSEEPYLLATPLLRMGRDMKATQQSARRVGQIYGNVTLRTGLVITDGGTTGTTPGTGTSSESYLFNVLDYGADRNGTADSSTAIQATVNKAAAAGGGTVFFPAGTYLLNDAGITLDDKVILQGAGRTQTTVQRTGSGTSKLFERAPTGENVFGIEIRDMTIEATSETTVVRLMADDGYEVQNVTLENVLLKNQYDAQNARCLEIGRQPRNVHIKNCIFIGCETPTTNLSRDVGQYTVMVNSAESLCEPEHSISFRDCIIKFGQIGLNVTSNSNPPGRTPALDMRGCEFEGQTKIGLRLYHGQGYKVIGNSFHDITCYPTAAELADTEYGTNWPVEKAAMWMDMIHANGSTDANRGSVSTIANNLIRNIEGNGMFLEDATNVQIIGNDISFITERTGTYAELDSIDPTGFTSVGGVGIFIGKGKGRPMIMGNNIHYCEHAGIRASTGFSPPTFSDESELYQIVNNRVHLCGDYGIRMDGHFNTTVNISHNQIEGDDTSTVAGIYFTKSASQSSTSLGISRLICVGNMIEGATYGVYKDYEMAAGSTGQKMQMVGNTINCIGTYSVYWQSANGAVIGNNFHGHSLALAKSGGGYNADLVVMGNNGSDDIITNNEVAWQQATVLKTTTGALTLQTDNGNIQLNPTSGNVTSSADAMMTGGLTVGSNSTEPDAGEVWLINGGTGKLRRNGANVEWWDGSAWQDLTVGAEASSNPGAASLVLKSDASGYLELEGLGVNATPGNNLIKSGGDIKAESGFVAGDTSYDPGAGQFIAAIGTGTGYTFRADSNAGHGLTAEMAGTDNYWQVVEENTTGGANIKGANGAAPQGLLLTGFAGSAQTTRTSTAPVTIYSYLTSGTGRTDASADMNVFAIRTQRAGSNRTLFVVDEDGDLHVDGSSTVGTFDTYDDVQLIRAADLTLAGHDIDKEFGEWLRYKRDDLAAAKIISLEEDGSVYLNVTRLQRVLTGAIWQLSERLKRLEGATDNE